MLSRTTLVLWSTWLLVQEELVLLGEEVAIMFRIYATKVITSTVKLFLFSIPTLITKWIVQLIVCICMWNGT